MGTAPEHSTLSWTSLRRGLIQSLPRPAPGADERLTLAARRDEVAVRHLRAIERAITERQRLRRDSLKRRFRLYFRREVLQANVRLLLPVLVFHAFANDNLR